MTKNKRLQHLRRPLPFFPLACGIALFAFIFGLYGFQSLPSESGGPLDWLASMYATLQLFILGGTLPKGPKPLALYVAVLFALFVFFYGLRAVLVLVAGYFHNLIFKPSRHTLIIGAGQLGLEIARNFRTPTHVGSASKDTGNDSKLSPIAFIDPSSERLEEAKTLFPGIFTFHGECIERLILENSRLHQASRIIIATDDELNAISTAATVGQFLYERRNHRHDAHFSVRRFMNKFQPNQYSSTNASCVLDCHVQVNRLFHGVTFSRIGLFRKFTGYMLLKPFNPCENAARVALSENPLDGRYGIGFRDSCRVHLVLSGCGSMGEALLLQAARIGHYANHLKLKALVVDPTGEERRRDLLHRYSELEKVIELEFINLPFEDTAVRKRLEEISNNQSARLTIAICLPDPSRAIEQALHLPPELVERSLQVLLRLDYADLLRFFPDRSIRSVDSKTLEEDVKGNAVLHMDSSKFKVFGTREQQANLCASEEIEKLARNIHESYCEKASSEGRLTSDLAGGWEKLDADLRLSNQLQAEHTDIKLRSLGYILSPRTDEDTAYPVPSFTPEEIEALAEAEHNRWNADRWLAGWRSSPHGTQKDSVNKTTPYLVPYAELDENIKDYDRDPIRKIITLAEKGGFVLRPIPKN